VGCEDCRVNRPGDGLGFEIALGGGGVVTAAARAAADELGRWVGGNPFWFDFGDSKGFICISSDLSGSLAKKGFSSRSLGLRDSVEPLFLSDRAVGGRSSINRASSICRRAICPLSSSSRAFHSGIDVQRVLRASMVEMNEAIAGVELP